MTGTIIYLYSIGLLMAGCLDRNAPSWRGSALAVVWPVSFPAVLIFAIRDRVRA